MSGDRPPHYFPAVGRHTDVLEGGRENPVGERDSKGPAQGTNSIRRPSVSETPEFKKAKLGEADTSMYNADVSGAGDISPGQSIEATATQHDISQGDLDVEIPELEQANSPSFASQAADVPHFPGLSTKGPEHVDLTEEDARLEAAANQDELQTARTGQDVGRGIARLLDQGHGQTNPVHFNSTLQANLPSGALINNSMQARNLSQQPYYTTAPPEMPPWLTDIHSGLLSLHSKADRQYAEISSTLQAQTLRISHVESVTAEHTDQHQQTQLKLKSLEAKIKDLEAIRDAAPKSPRSFPGAPRSPRSPRSPRQPHFGQDYFEEEPDMDLVIGGWVDARRDDAIEETRNILRDTQLLDHIEEVWAPYSRTSFVKVRICLDKDLPIAARRKRQTSILEKLKAKKYVSGVAGSENIKLWVTRSKSPEERRMTRAIVICKEFYARLPHKDPSKPLPFPENLIDISWNGKVFIGRHQLLGNVYRDGEPGAHDLILTDARGDHLEWFLFSKVFANITGRQEEDLQAVWDQFRPSERE